MVFSQTWREYPGLVLQPLAHPLSLLSCPLQQLTVLLSFTLGSSVDLRQFWQGTQGSSRNKPTYSLPLYPLCFLILVLWGPFKSGRAIQLSLSAVLNPLRQVCKHSFPDCSWLQPPSHSSLPWSPPPSAAVQPAILCASFFLALDISLIIIMLLIILWRYLTLLIYSIRILGV